MSAFDDALIISEKFFPQYLHLFREAKIFVISEGQAIDYCSPGADCFFLPYPVTAVMMDSYYLTIFSDTVEGQIGFKNRRELLFCHSTTYGGDKKHDGKYVFAHGFIADYIEGENDDRLKCSMDCTVIATKDRILFDYENEMLAHYRRNDLSLRERLNVSKAMVEYDENIKELLDFVDENLAVILSINNPNRFILEKAPVKQQITGKKIPRSHQRPEYTILSPSRIREEMRLPQIRTGKGKSPAPHDVRRHDRWLSDKKYRFDPKTGLPLELKEIPRGPRKGELYYRHKIIEAHWSGPSENRVGNKIYRVILDR